MTLHRPLAALALAVTSLVGHAESASAPETASFAVSTDLRLTTDQRNRAISDSLNRPGAKLTVQAAHESGVIAQVELGTVSRKQFLGGNGSNVTLALGYRFGDPEAWHFGAGFATERFPGASFEAPHRFDPLTGTPGDVRRTRYNAGFVVPTPAACAARCCSSCPIRRGRSSAMRAAIDHRVAAGCSTSAPTSTWPRTPR